MSRLIDILKDAKVQGLGPEHTPHISNLYTKSCHIYTGLFERREGDKTYDTRLRTYAGAVCNQYILSVKKSDAKK